MLNGGIIFDIHTQAIMALQLKPIKNSFPIFENRPTLIYLDNASTSQKPHSVIRAITDFYAKEYANVHRGLYDLSEEATMQYEQVRAKVASFIGAANSKSIAFTKGTTESINIIASGFLKRQLNEGDEVLISAMEHHANLIPWQQVCKEKGAYLNVIPVDENGNLELDKLDLLLNNKTKLLAITHISNTIGTVNPVREIINTAHQKNVPVLVDAAQSVSHFPLNVRELDADFLVFSAHKMFGPMGTGILYVKEKFQNKITPLCFGGGAVKNVEVTETDFLEYPGNIEAGTPNVSGVIGLGAAIDFMNTLDMNEVDRHVSRLAIQLRIDLNKMEGVKVVGDLSNKSGIVSFVDEHIHPHDIATFLASKNIAVRAGHHCTQPLLDYLGIHATVRASFSVYNTQEDVERILEVLRETKKFWA